MKHGAGIYIPTTRKRKHPTLLVLILVTVSTLGYLIAWRYHHSVHIDIQANPYSAKVTTSVSFPLYYPTYLPKGYTIDDSSINQPQSGIVILTLKDTEHHKIYMSQEARPVSFNFGSYYQGFTNLKEVPVASGTIAVGYINNGQTLIGSLATGQTWVIINTTAPLSPDQFITLLQKLALNN